MVRPFLFLFSFTIFHVAAAVPTISHATMTEWTEHQGGLPLALAAQPMWFFSRALNHRSCYPTSCLVAHNTSAHNTVEVSQTQPAPLCNWPNVGCHCRKPDVPAGNPGPSFPVYYTWNQCSPGEVRVVYNLYYQKDGFNPNKINGHAHDWERCVVVWTQTNDTAWSPTKLLISQHSWYENMTWGEIPSTFDAADAHLPKGGPDGLKNRDHPKVYAAWSKHAHFSTPLPVFTDVISQLLDNAYRGEDWWYFPTEDDYVDVMGQPGLASTISNMDWGQASSNPPRVQSEVCS